MASFSGTLIFAALATVVSSYYFQLNYGDFLNGEPCGFGKLPCDSGEECVIRTGWCDGMNDCMDGSDERYCQERIPSDDNDLDLNGCDPSLHFMCPSGYCIPKIAKCDDTPDCDPGVDEDNCDWSDSTEESGTKTTTKPTTVKTLSMLSKSIITSSPPPLIPLLGDALVKALRRLLAQRDSHWGWGRATAKLATALHLANDSYFAPSNAEGHLTAKQIQVQLAVDLMRHSESPIPLHELSHYIHALLVTCQDPRDFHGVNIVKLLKKEVNRRRSKRLFVSPLAYLALCNAGDFHEGLIRRIKNMAYRRNDEQRWLDVQAFALLTISCRSRTNFSSVEWKLLKKDVAKNLTEWQQPDGSFGSIYSTGLVLQALIAAEESGTESAKGRALTYLHLRQDWEGGFGGLLDDFYVLPALNRNSLVSIANRRCHTVTSLKDTLNTEAGVPERIGKKRSTLHYSLWIGGDRSEMHTITLSMPPHSSFLQVMEAAERSNPKYQHEVWITARGTVVNAIAGRSSDVEKGAYWTLYRKVPLPFRPQLTNGTATVARLRLMGATKYIKDIRKLYPKDGEHLAFWFKPFF